MEYMDKLREAGYHVKVTHRRRFHTWEPDASALLSRFEAEKADVAWSRVAQCGGETVVQVTAPDGTTSLGVASCSVSDAFCNATGLKIALRRAMDGFPREQRKAVFS